MNEKGEVMSSQICTNCKNPKQDHTKHDTFCLELNGWTPEELERAPAQTSQIPNRHEDRHKVAA
jgi:hypothetical protein